MANLVVAAVNALIVAFLTISMILEQFWVVPAMSMRETFLGAVVADAGIWLLVFAWTGDSR